MVFGASAATSVTVSLTAAVSAAGSGSAATTRRWRLASPSNAARRR